MKTNKKEFDAMNTTNNNQIGYFKMTTNNISLNGYIDFAKNLSKDVDFFLNYDTNFTLNGFKHNYKNMKILEENGIKVIPVVHDYLYENFDEIDVYLKKNIQL